MTNQFGAISVAGLAEAQRALRDVDSRLGTALRKALNEAADIVVQDAKPRVPVRSGAARASLRVSSTQTRTRVSAGGKKSRYFPWLDFGGKRRGRGGGIAERPFRKTGRYVWHSLARKRPLIVETIETGVVAVLRQAGLEVTRA